MTGFPDIITHLEVRCGEEIIGAADVPHLRPVRVIVYIRAYGRNVTLHGLADDGTEVYVKALSEPVMPNDQVTVDVRCS